jgi:hypothetical protein
MTVKLALRRLGVAADAVSRLDHPHPNLQQKKGQP